jgi:signal transduction histidine kinase/ActR/RegA family two-component response regulator
MESPTDEARTPRRRHEWVPRYFCAVASVGAALVGTRALGEQTAGVSPLFFGAVAVSAWYGGLGPGLLATLLSGLLTAFFLFEPAYSLRIQLDDVIRVAVFCLVAVLIGVLQETSRRERGKALAAGEQAMAANRAKDRFLAVLSHELRNPLNPILTLAAVLESDDRLPADVREDMRMIGRNAQLQLRLVDDLLDLNRIVRGKLALCRELVDAHSLVEEVLAMCGADAVAKGLGLDACLAADRHHLYGDGGRLRQVFWNLVRNAMKFTPAGGRVTVTTANGPDGTLRVEVTDTGIGVEPEALNRIFMAFEQADESVGRQFGGLGLGLAISKSLIEGHGGTVSASSPGKGAGATFTLRLPVVEGEAGGGAGSQPGTGQTRHYSNAVLPQRIMVGDSDAGSSRATCRLLREHGHQVTAIASVPEALRATADADFDLMILDLSLPEGNVFSLMRALRRPGLRSLAMGVYGTQDEWRKSYDAGFDEYLTKPVGPQTLEAAIRRLSRGASPGALRLAGST